MESRDVGGVDVCDVAKYDMEIVGVKRWFPTRFGIKFFSVLTVEGLGVDGRHKICCQDTTWSRCKFKELKGVNIYSTFS